MSAHILTIVSRSSVFAVVAACSTSMNSNFSLTDDPWQSTPRIFLGNRSPNGVRAPHVRVYGVWCARSPSATAHRRHGHADTHSPSSRVFPREHRVPWPPGQPDVKSRSPTSPLLHGTQECNSAYALPTCSLSDDPNLSGAPVRKVRGTSHPVGVDDQFLGAAPTRRVPLLDGEVDVPSRGGTVSVGRERAQWVSAPCRRISPGARSRCCGSSGWRRGRRGPAVGGRPAPGPPPGRCRSCRRWARRRAPPRRSTRR